MITRPSHNKQEIDRPGVDQQKSLRVAASTGHVARHALQGRASFSPLVVRCEREREADRLLQRLARRCLHCVGFALLLLLRMILQPALQLKQTPRPNIHSLTVHSSAVVYCPPRCHRLCPVSIPSSTRATRSSPRRHVRHPSYTIWPLP
jgi:hypothetical protein